MRLTLLLTSIILGALVHPGDAEEIICTNGYMHHGDICYKILDSVTSVSWMEAVRECQKESGQLAEPRSLEISEFLRELTNLHHEYKGQNKWFIGLTDMFSGNKWVLPSDTSEPPYTLWKEGSPSMDRLNNLNCAMMEWNNGTIRWRDVGCVDFKGSTSNPISPICERKRCPRSGSYITTRYFNNRCYHTKKSYGSVMDWQMAEDHCVSLGGNLASVASVEENQFLIENFGGDHWLGGQLSNDTDKDLIVWSDGLTSKLAFWDERQSPIKMGERIVLMGGRSYSNRGSGSWRSGMPTTKLYTLCKN